MKTRSTQVSIESRHKIMILIEYKGLKVNGSKVKGNTEYCFINFQEFKIIDAGVGDWEGYNTGKDKKKKKILLP